MCIRLISCVGLGSEMQDWGLKWIDLTQHVGDLGTNWTCLWLVLISMYFREGFGGEKGCSWHSGSMNRHWVWFLLIPRLPFIVLEVSKDLKILVNTYFHFEALFLHDLLWRGIGPLELSMQGCFPWTNCSFSFLAKNKNENCCEKSVYFYF